jgi:acyl-CoA synthetase (AMP-forming)/AMP-acid ligase II
LNLVESLLANASARPAAAAFRIEGRPDDDLSYGGLLAAAQSVAVRLADIIRPNDRVVIQYESPIEFIPALLGSMLVGATVVPSEPVVASGRRRDSLVERLRAIVDDADAAVVLVNADCEAEFADVPARASVLGLTPDPRCREFVEPRHSPTALIQFTSGSTARPRGVVLSHSNLTANINAIIDRLGLTSTTVGVSWLPLFHDMGLIGSVCTNVMAGSTTVLLPPTQFLTRPLDWLRAIAHHGASFSGGPAFGYAHCVRRAHRLDEDVDLSSWRVAAVGAEPIDIRMLREFATAFGPHGFDAKAFYPCYGLAESTLFAAGARERRAPKTAVVSRRALEADQIVESPRERADERELVSCGESLDDHAIRVVDPRNGDELPPGRVGEILVFGPSVSTASCPPSESDPRVTVDDTGHKWLRTGDLGFMVDGELFVSGRLKDVIIIRGRNYAAEDIEQTAGRAHPALSPDFCAAVSLSTENGEGLGLVLAARSAADPGELKDAVRGAISLQHGIMPSVIEIVRQREMPRTSSGKIRRFQCREIIHERGIGSDAAPIRERVGDELGGK